MRILGLGIVVALVGAGSAQAGVVLLSSATALRSAAGRPLLHEGFERCARVTRAFVGPLSAGGAGPCGPGALAVGLTITDDGGAASELYSARARYAGNSSVAIGQNGAASEGLVLGFGGGTRAAGFTLFQNAGGGASVARPVPVIVEAFGQSGLLARFETQLFGPRGLFIGVASDGAALTRLRVNGASNYDLVDNVLFAAARPPLVSAARFAFAPEPVAQTPEPAVPALVAAAVGVLAASRRSRARV